jgi:processive 1,2-diacylglycerol beta-glucosyltransferase
MWLSRIFHRYFVALEDTKMHLEALGLPADRITVSGIPIDPIFAEAINRDEVLARYNLRTDLPILLLSAGAIGVGPTEMIVRRLLELKQEAQTIVICGRSEELRQQITEIVGAENPRFRVLGYTDRMHELMQLSDLFIGKPGGLTTSEALACGLPMCIVAPIPGQEERNSDHLLEKGVAIKANELTTLPWKIDQLLGDRERLVGMRANALKYGRPHAARDVVQTLIEDELTPLILDKEQRKAIAEAAAKEP